MSEYLDDEPADIGGEVKVVEPGEVTNEDWGLSLVLLDVSDEFV